MEICNVNLTGVEEYKKENQELADWVLNTYFFKIWDADVPYSNEQVGRTLELIISPKCNLGCKYCYVNRFHKQLFDEENFDEEKVLDNLKLICAWLKKNNYNPSLEIFSGELFAQELGFKVMDVLIDYYKSVEPKLRAHHITIPTNFTFLCSDEATARVSDIHKRLEELNIEFWLSASFDGKYMEQNRPYTKDLDIPLGGLRDDTYYDKVFEFAVKHYSGFHPMVYSKNLELWPKNFEWFQQKFVEYDLPFDSIYLLQVRNVEWNQTDIKNLQHFIDYLYRWLAENQFSDRRDLTNFVIKDGFNILSWPFCQTSRGLTCGLQDTLHIRVSDLMVYPCHRLGYKDFYCGQLVPDTDKVLKYVNKNVELLTAVLSVDKMSLPYCAQCPINHLCQGPCLGAQYEATNNMFTPIPSVCSMTYALLVQSIKSMKEYGNWGQALTRISPEKVEQFYYLERNS